MSFPFVFFYALAMPTCAEANSQPGLAQVVHATFSCAARICPLRLCRFLLWLMSPNFPLLETIILRYANPFSPYSSLAFVSSGHMVWFSKASISSSLVTSSSNLARLASISSPIFAFLRSAWCSWTRHLCASKPLSALTRDASSYFQLAPLYASMVAAFVSDSAGARHTIAALCRLTLGQARFSDIPETIPVRWLGIRRVIGGARVSLYVEPMMLGA